MNGGFVRVSWVAFAMLDSSTFQDDSRPGMSRDARAELRVKTVLEEVGDGQMIPGDYTSIMLNPFRYDIS